MTQSAALLVDEVLPHQPMRQWVLSVPFPLRFLFASQPAVMGKVLGIVQAHADDMPLCSGGLVAKLVDEGYKAFIIQTTRTRLKVACARISPM